MAFLTGLRLKKPLVVHTGTGQMWTAYLRRMSRYDELVMHYDIRHPADSPQDEVKVVIHNVSIDEWMGTCDNNVGVHTFLRLMEARLGADDVRDVK